MRRNEEEGNVVDLVHKYRHQLVEKGAELVRQDRRNQDVLQLDQSSGMAVFEQLLEGCLLTLAFTEQNGAQLCILNWRFPNALLN